MAKPYILAVDDDPQVAKAVVQDLRSKYAKDYQILSAVSGDEALETIAQLKQRNAPLALMLVDQRMPGMSGTELLRQAMEYYADARKVLLTAYADTEAAIDSINAIGLDHYLLKPWDPPDQFLYPVLDDLLGDWVATVPVPFDGIRVAGTLWSSKSHETKDFLARNRIPYQWLDIETDKEAEALVESVQTEKKLLPAVFFPDGTYLIAPDNINIAEKVGLKTEASEPFYDLIIIGGGPAGLGAAVYGASEGLRTLMLEQHSTGGQAGTSSRIENYLGFPKGVSGADLARRATDQATRLGAEILTAKTANEVGVDSGYRSVMLDDGTELRCRSLIVATGVSVRKLDLPKVEELSGAGIYYGAALTEAANYRDKDVFVIGGANSAGQAAMYFSRYAKKVTMIVRASALTKGMSQYLVDQIEATDNIEVRLRTIVDGVSGESQLEKITLRDINADTVETIPATAMFIFIGAVPHSEMVADVVLRNRAGFIMTGTNLLKGKERLKGWSLSRDPYPLECSVPGIFAAGDVRMGAVRRVASAVGEGAIAVSQVHQYLKTV
jgi:thioredoxin reductase (NADPH)